MLYPRHLATRWAFQTCVPECVCVGSSRRKHWDKSFCSRYINGRVYEHYGKLVRHARAFIPICWSVHIVVAPGKMRDDPVCMYNGGKQKSRAEQEADRLRQLIQLLVGGKQFPHVQIHPLSHHHLSTLVITASSSNYLATRLGLFFFCRRTIVNAVPQAASYFSLLFLHYLYCENVKADIQLVCYP